MDALEFIRERNRMCKSFGVECENCPANKDSCCDVLAWKEELVTIVEKWSKENPCKTLQSLFLEQYPYVRSVDGVIMICPKMLDTSFSCPIDDNIDCSACKHEFWNQEIQ